MKIGISTICYSGFKETEDALGLIAETGAEAAEAYLRTFYEYRPEFAKRYVLNAKAPRISYVHVNPQDFEPHLFSPSRRIRGDGFYWLDQVCRSAQLLGAEYFVLHGPVRNGEDNRYDEWSGYINGVIEFCKGYGIKVALENVSFGLYNKPPVFSELKLRCPELFAVLDMKQAFAAKCPIDDYLKDMSGAIAAVHLSDVDQNGKSCLLGEGVTDFKKLFIKLRKIGFDGAALINCLLYDENDLRKNFDFINKTINTL